MAKVIRLWAIWLMALAAGVYGTSLIYRAIANGITMDYIYGIPVLLFGIWITGNIWASARQFYRQQRIQTGQHLQRIK